VSDRFLIYIYVYGENLFIPGVRYRSHHLSWIRYRTKLSWKIVYYYLIFAIVNKILVNKDCQINTTYAECKRTARCDRLAIVVWCTERCLLQAATITRATRSGSPVSVVNCKSCKIIQDFLIQLSFLYLSTNVISTISRRPV